MNKLLQDVPLPPAKLLHRQNVHEQGRPAAASRAQFASHPSASRTPNTLKRQPRCDTGVLALRLRVTENQRESNNPVFTLTFLGTGALKVSAYGNVSYLR